MYKVEVKNGCKCFKGSGFPELSEFSTEAEAKEEAEYILKIMKSNFCQTHQFELVQDSDDFTIFIKDKS